MKELLVDPLIKFFNFEGISLWAYEIFIIVLLVLTVSLAARQVIAKLAVRAANTQNPWDDALVSALRTRVNYLILITGISFAIEIANQDSAADINNLVSIIRYVLIIITLSWGLIVFISGVQDASIQLAKENNTGADATTIRAVAKLLRTAVIITTVLIVMQTLGFSVSGVMAFGGIGGIAIGFAAKDLLANFFGALTIYLDRPFSEGDWIRSPDREIEGIIENIGWRLTVIRSFDKRPIYVPNSVFASIAVENASRMSHRRIYENIGLRYADINQMEAIVAAVTKMLRSHKEIDQTQTLIVNFTEFSSSSVDFMVYTFTKTTQWVRFQEIKQDVLLQIANIIDQHDAEMAFPSRSLYVEDNVTIQALVAKTAEKT
ncbi:MAG: mechanosensitive ion channel family protein [Gammaproteobacteria bacterium]|nr:mechanosensitive ion channel family protein [Gammaproteobacteria bacterium]